MPTLMTKSTLDGVLKKPNKEKKLTTNYMRGKLESVRVLPAVHYASSQSVFTGDMNFFFFFKDILKIIPGYFQ